MKKFCYKFLIVLLSISMLVPTWLTVGATKAKAAAPTVTVNSLITNDQRPELTGTVDDNLATMNIYVETKGYTGVSITGSLSPYTWTLPNDTITPNLSKGVYDITASATNSDGSSIDSTSGELTIDITAPVVDITAPIAGSRVNSDAIISFTDSELTAAECGIDANAAASCVSEMTKLSDLAGFSTVAEDSSFSLKLTDKDVAGNIGDDYVNLIKDTTPPGIPAGLSYTQTGGVVQLSWGALTDLDLIGYNIYRASSPYEKINTSLIIANNYIDTPGVGSFQYKVTAVDQAGNESDYSSEISVDLSQLPAPTNLVATVGNREVLLIWDAVVGVDYYNVYYQKFSDPVYSNPIATTLTSTKITRLENGIKYRFIVRAVRIVGTEAIESANAWLEATPIAPKVVLAAAPVEIVEEPIPVTPEVQPTPPTVKEPTEEGKILGEETPTETETEKINWTPWIILFILIILAGAATGGYFYWFGREEEEIITKKIVEKSKEPAKRGRKSTKTTSKKNKRW